MPDGFSYVEGSTTPGPEDIRVSVQDQTVRFTLAGDEEFTYKVTASSTEGDYTFVGILKDENRDSYPVGRDAVVTVTAGTPEPSPEPSPEPGPSGPNATRSFSTMSVAPGGELSVTITARDYGFSRSGRGNIARWVQLRRRLYNSWAGRY